jgi:hypothetical protein
MDEFTCARCRRKFNKGRSDEEALAEAEALFTPGEMDGNLEIICDDCYKEFLEWGKTSPLGPARLQSWSASPLGRSPCCSICKNETPWTPPPGWGWAGGIAICPSCGHVAPYLGEGPPEWAPKLGTLPTALDPRRLPD